MLEKTDMTWRGEYFACKSISVDSLLLTAFTLWCLKTEDSRACLMFCTCRDQVSRWL